MLQMLAECMMSMLSPIPVYLPTLLLNSPTLAFQYFEILVVPCCLATNGRAIRKGGNYSHAPTHDPTVPQAKVVKSGLQISPKHYVKNLLAVRAVWQWNGPPQRAMGFTWGFLAGLMATCNKYLSCWFCDLAADWTQWPRDSRAALYFCYSVIMLCRKL